MGCISRSSRYVIFAALVYIASTISADENGARKYTNTIDVTVNGSHDYQKCPTEGNCSLEAAFQAVVNTRKFNSSTEIRITAGNYELNKSFAFYDFDGLALVGTSSANTADNTLPLIQCNGSSAGIAFYKCRNILIQSISLFSCGVLYNSSTYKNPLFYSAIFVEYNENFMLSNVAIRESRGVGVTMYDTIGNVTIYKALFENNGPKNISCQRSDSKNSSQDGKTIAGGGLYIEFTYKETEYAKNSHYHILQSNFTGNIAPFPNLENATFQKPGGDKYIGFGRGGGLSLYIRGSAMNNSFWIVSCIFQDNHAIWGGGYFIQFLDTVQENQITIFNVTVTKNSACFGGGAFQLSAISRVGNTNNFVPNKLQSSLCLFLSNVAISGGGGTIYGRSSIGYKNNKYSFNNCTWIKNEAAVGSALTLKLWDYSQGLFGPNSPFKVELIDCNIIENTMRETAMMSGIGALYDFLVPLLLKDVTFTRNTNTSLVIDTSSVTIMGHVTFINNTGFKGGAVAMYGEASFNLTKDSNLTFKANIAEEKGGAIFVQTPGPASVPVITSNYLRTHECFFKYEDRNTNPNDWHAEVNFIDNTAQLASGYSVFANSLKDCIFPGDEDTGTVLQWNTFHYYVTNSSRGTASNRSFEITTDAIKISYNRSDWFVPPDQIFSPEVKLLDEKNNSVYGMVHIKVIPALDQPLPSVKLGTPTVLFLVRDNIPFLDLKGIPATNFSINLRTAGAGQVVEKNLGGLVLGKCNPGFFQKDGECVCLSVTGYSGVSRCSKDGKHVYLENGYWGGEVISESKELEFVTAQCPSGYCNCMQPTDETVRTDECVYDASDMCEGNRRGVLCGSCKGGLSVKVGDEDCSAECDNSDLWRLAPLLIFLTILVLVIFKINMDIFTCYMNAWLYFYQVINLVTSGHKEVYLDPFIRFIIGLANITIDGPFASCMWKGMDNLTKLAFSYVLPVYVFLVVFIIGLVARKYPDSYFAKNSTFRASCTLFVLCYSSLTSVSMEILRPSKLGNSIVVFHQGTVKYFSDYHTYFAVPAILILLFVVVPFPFILMFTPFFIKRVRFVSYATPLFNTFQACFKDGYRWFAAFYFFCRFFFLLFATFVPYGEAKTALIQIACVFVLSIHVYLCPYVPQYDWINKLDSLLLITLTTISIIAGQMTKNLDRNVMMIIIDILAYIPLVYTVALGSYLLYKWVKTKLHVGQPVAEFEHFNDAEDGNDSATVKVI